MKNTGKCPKCGCAEIIRIDRNPSDGNVVYVGFLKHIDCARFVCAACGYVEEWIRSQADIGTLREKCPRHSPGETGE
jgi:predicted nucleic-acid-binding Zn-ribbon protein